MQDLNTLSEDLKASDLDLEDLRAILCVQKEGRTIMGNLRKVRQSLERLEHTVTLERLNQVSPSEWPKVLNRMSEVGASSTGRI